MTHAFPYDNLIAGILVLVVGFGFHWIGQGLSLLNRELAIRLGIWERDMPPEYAVYEEAIAVADVSLGWLYGIAGVGLILGTSWGYRLAWFPGAILLYHAISFWFWTRNQRRAGYRHGSANTPLREVWTVANLGTALLTIVVAWNGS